MVPALRRRLKVELAAPENPEDDRLRLFSGVLERLRNIGGAHPVVLEDLQRLRAWLSARKHLCGN
jgi:hypothetical protein